MPQSTGAHARRIEKHRSVIKTGIRPPGGGVAGGVGDG